MRIDPDIYDYRNLKECDKKLVDTIEDVKENVLSPSVIEAFIEIKSISGSTLQSVYRDVLNEFISFLQERAEYSKVDLIIEKIESYSEEEFEQLYENAKKTANN